MPAARRIEGASLTFPGDGTLTLGLNVQIDRPGPRLGLSAPGRRAPRHRRRARLRHRHGDSALEIAGYASVGSRSAMTAGASIVKCIDVMLEKGKRIAAQPA